MSTNVRLQNLREMTVQIRRLSDDAIVGTGIAVSTDGKIVTCAHVVEAAIDVHPRDSKGAEIGVYFPQLRGSETKSRRVIVAKCFPQHDDDVVLLQLTEGASPLAPEQIVVLGKAEASEGNPFRSYGFRPLPPYLGGWADGRIMGCVDCPEGINLQAEPVQLDCKHIAAGMSGAPVLDTERNLVVGIISETWFPDATTKDRDTGWAVNARVLSLAPLGLPVQDAPLDRKAAPSPKFDVARAEAAIFIKQKYSWNNAPAVLPEWTGRDDLLAQITQDWLDPNKRVTGLIGFGGEGKSLLARKWVDDLLSNLPNCPTPDGIFWWGFYENRSKVFIPLIYSVDTVGAQYIVPQREMVNRLASYRILRFDAHDRTYTAHPLIRNHYYDLLIRNPKQKKEIHEHIKDYYLSISGDTPQYPTLDDLKPLIEVVHHSCQAGAHDEAWKVYLSRIQQRPDKFILNRELGSFDTDLSLLFRFFPNGDTSLDSLISGPNDKRWILNQIGWCLISLGRLSEAVPFYERVIKAGLEAEDWHNTSITNQNLSNLHASLGAIKASAQAARKALDLAGKTDNKGVQCVSLAFQGLANHLLGNLQTASNAFARAEQLEQEDNSDIRYLFSLRGINHANHLRRTEQSEYARRVTEANLQILERLHMTYQISQCHRVLGDLDSDSGNHISALSHYDTALEIARSISHRPSLIEVLLARGKWQARYMKDAQAAFSDLDEALNYAVESGYRIYETVIRVALAWAYSVNSGQRVVSSMQSARAEAERALQMSKEMDYYWGKVDTEEVLAVLEGK